MAQLSIQGIPQSRADDRYVNEDSFTAGSVLFSNGDNVTEDNANLFWDDTNDRFGIGTNSPSAQLHTTKGRIVGTNRYTANQTLDAENHHVFCDTDGGAFTITLPAGVAGTYYRIINTGSSANALTITPNGAELLVGANSNFTLNDGEALTIVYESTEGWF